MSLAAKKQPELSLTVDLRSKNRATLKILGFISHPARDENKLYLTRTHIFAAILQNMHSGLPTFSYTFVRLVKLDIERECVNSV